MTSLAPFFARCDRQGRSIESADRFGPTVAQQIEQTNALLEDIAAKPTTAVVELGHRGVDAEVAPSRSCTAANLLRQVTDQVCACPSSDICPLIRLRRQAPNETVAFHTKRRRARCSHSLWPGPVGRTMNVIFGPSDFTKSCRNTLRSIEYWGGIAGVMTVNH